METIADRVQKLLALKGWSQSELSRRAGLTRSHVGWIINHPGSPVETDTLRKIADGAGASKRWLLTGSGTPDSLDADAPSTTTAVLGHAPVYANALGWDDAVQEFAATPEGQRTPKTVIHTAGQHAPYELHGPVTKDIVAALVRLVLAETDPAKALQRAEVAEARVAQLEAWKREMEAGVEDFERQKAALLAGGGKKPKAGGRG